MSFTEIVYGVLFQPVNTFRYLKEARPLGLSLLIWAAVIILSVVIGQGEAYVNNEIKSLGLPLQVAGMLNWVVGLFSFIMLFVMAGIYSLLADIIYGRNNAKGLLVCLALASLPGVLGSALSYVLALAGIKWLGMLFSLAAGMWVIVLQILALREALELTTSGALLIYFIPFIVLFIFALLLIVLIGIAGYSSFNAVGG
ncbi:Yip1 domain-containing protein [Thermosyntropha lipolytica DSM 11003]|uniref:Yip1 domain-containing protein n=1 Tax=Thermosyntropha lipolytica DSM 11003 TaxID=1123382 RepID=A0A1M5PZD9_9FIRM|nr:Yip1 family protein [Thermosyntropha lipolytica]SHH07060.1 Yip1 domain-containing protein [Thermosyntropha lipolytica DSM 11003]